MLYRYSNIILGRVSGEITVWVHFALENILR